MDSRNLIHSYIELQNDTKPNAVFFKRTPVAFTPVNLGLNKFSRELDFW